MTEEKRLETQILKSVCKQTASLRSKGEEMETNRTNDSTLTE